TGTNLSAIPAYEHANQDEIFATLETLIRELLDAIIPSRVIPIGLTRSTSTVWTGRFSDERLVEGADYYLSVKSTLPALQLVELIPKLCKIGSPDDIQHLINSALTGIPLNVAHRVPAAIPVRLDNHYFALDPSAPALARMRKAHACHIYLPGSVPDAELELFAVLTS
ncbi:MAG TPA: type VI secretion system baseplate subunit TssK, partial [Steroidobacteraceae bacterium]|nr:type VI secretion system baseplate subunit TssK [Steroidobacteraceae bacterium]